MALPLQLAAPGAGLIGKRPIAHVLNEDCAALMAIVDPSPQARSLAAETQAGWCPDFTAIKQAVATGAAITLA